MNIHEFMAGYQRAWQTSDEHLLASLFTPDGVYRNTLGEAGDSLLTLVTGVAVAEDGTILVSEPGSDRVLTYAPLP